MSTTPPSKTRSLKGLSLFSFFSLALFVSSVYARPATNQSVVHVSKGHRSLDLHRRCMASTTTFSSPSDISPNGNPQTAAPFIALSPSNTYAVTENGLEMYLYKPEGEVQSNSDGINNNLGQGATFNSSFSMQSGRVTFEAKSESVPGVVAAFILLDAVDDWSDGQVHQDEIDDEVAGKDSKSWQANVFKPSKADMSPHYGYFSSKDRFAKGSTFTTFHKYSICWDQNKIVWGMDGQDVRTLYKQDTYIDGVPHFPTDEMRLQVGIWDGSGAKGTSSWSGGPVQWESAPNPVVATLRSVQVECQAEC